MRMHDYYKKCVIVDGAAFCWFRHYNDIVDVLNQDIGKQAVVEMYARGRLVMCLSSPLGGGYGESLLELISKSIDFQDSFK